MRIYFLFFLLVSLNTYSNASGLDEEESQFLQGGHRVPTREGWEWSSSLKYKYVGVDTRDETEINFTPLHQQMWEEEKVIFESLSKGQINNVYLVRFSFIVRPIHADEGNTSAPKEVSFTNLFKNHIFISGRAKPKVAKSEQGSSERSDDPGKPEQNNQNKKNEPITVANYLDAFLFSRDAPDEDKGKFYIHPSSHFNILDNVVERLITRYFPEEQGEESGITNPPEQHRPKSIMASLAKEWNGLRKTNGQSSSNDNNATVVIEWFQKAHAPLEHDKLPERSSKVFLTRINDSE